jgi:membrane protease YdiL (CAAX protease family)
LFATLGVALFAWMSGARSVDYHRGMPNFSRGDVARLLFAYGEHERHLHPDRLAPGDPVSKLETARNGEELAGEAAELMKSESRQARHLATAGIKDLYDAMRVVVAGWGIVEQIESLRQTGVGSLPDYLAPRAAEILLGNAAPDRARAARSRGFYAVVRGLQLAVMGIGALALLGLWLTRRSDGALARGVVPLAALWSVVVFVWGKAGAAAFARFIDVVLEWPDLVTNFWSVIRAVIVVALVQSTWGKGPNAPLARMLAVPKDPAYRRRWLLTSAAGAGACLAVSEGLHSLARSLHVYDGEFVTRMVAPIVYGSSWTAALKALDLLGAPFVEEILYRGLLFGGLVPRLGLVPAALLSSTVFSVVHGYALVPSLILVVHGCIFSVAYARTGSLVPSMIAHGAINLCADAYSFGYRLDVP